MLSIGFADSFEHRLRRDRSRVEPSGAQPRGLQEQVKNHVAVQFHSVTVVAAYSQQVVPIAVGVMRRLPVDFETRWLVM